MGVVIWTILNLSVVVAITLSTRGICSKGYSSGVYTHIVFVNIYNYSPWYMCSGYLGVLFCFDGRWGAKKEKFFRGYTPLGRTLPEHAHRNHRTQSRKSLKKNCHTI